ncbi:MAG TPA: aminotransferase class V-fold PLP-dependent enzyme, partial [Steroidobacteraceae bacterium]
GTPPIAAAIGLAAALDYVEGIGRERIAAHEQLLLRQATAQLGSLPYVRLVGTAPLKAAVLSFTMEGVHPHDIGTILDSEGIAIRTGHHCAMPIMERFGLAATARASFALYNRAEEIERLVAALRKVRELFG